MDKKKNLIVLARGIAYTALFNEKNTLTPYIVAWHFDPDSYTWDQGYYFSDRKSAVKFFWLQERNNANCKYCERMGCPHRNALRRLPREKGGLGLCKNFE
jgi:hypothetical protein